MSARSRQPKARGGRLTVRQFRPEDAEQASRVMVEAFTSFLPAKGRAKILAHFAPDILAGTSSSGATAACYVAVADAKVLGYVRGSVTPHGVGSLGVIGVSPNSFHTGVGSRLMRKMEAFWRKHGMRKVSTCVSAHNSRALCFYLHHGFRPVGYQRDHFLPGMDEVILDRFLD